MRLFTTLFALVIIISNAFTQEINEGTLRIIGKAKEVIIPDLATFTFQLDVKEKNQSIAQSKLIQETNKLIEKLQKLGYKKNDIKFLSFNVVEDIDYSGDKPKKLGYSATNEIELSIFYEPVKISQFIDSIGASNFKYFNYTFKLEVSESLKNSTREILIKNAIENAKQSAKAISDNANIDLVRISEIDYRDLVFNFSAHGDFLPPPPVANYDIRQSDTRLRFENLSLKETEVYEEVVIKWKIKNVR
jgi:uncharacterized protein YggE